MGTYTKSHISEHHTECTECDFPVRMTQNNSQHEEADSKSNVFQQRHRPGDQHWAVTKTQQQWVRKETGGNVRYNAANAASLLCEKPHLESFIQLLVFETQPSYLQTRGRMSRADCNKALDAYVRWKWWVCFEVKQLTARYSRIFMRLFPP